MEPEISLLTMQKELDECVRFSNDYGWSFSEVDKVNLTFTVRLTKSRDNETYRLYVQFDNYKQWPPFLDFIDETSGHIGVKSAYPKCNDSFFNFYNGQPVICHPFSRKAYKGFTGLHQDWGEYEGWVNIRQHGVITNMLGLLTAIHARLNSAIYEGRMEPRQNPVA